MTFMKSLLGAAIAAGLALGAVSGAGAQETTIAIVGGKADDPFFAKVKHGIDAAATLVEAHGGKVNYLPLLTYENIGPDAAQLIRNAIAQGADAIAAPDWVPDAQDGAFKAATDAGIPIIVYNSGGMEKAKELGAINYVGTEDYIAGVAGGRYFAEKGIRNILCVNTVPGAANLEARCQGMFDGANELGATSSQLPLPASSFGDPTAVAEAIKAQLLTDESIDGVITQGSQDASSAATGIAQASAGNRVALGTFNLDSGSLQRIQDGEQLFVIDQQGYLQGFLAVFLLDSYLNYAIDTPSKPILTGPAIVDASNIAATLQGVAAGIR